MTAQTSGSGSSPVPSVPALSPERVRRILVCKPRAGTCWRRFAERGNRFTQASAQLSHFGGKATRTSGVVRVLSDEVSRGGARGRDVVVRRFGPRFQGFAGSGSGGARSRIGSRQPWLRRRLLRQQVCGLHDYG